MSAQLSPLVGDCGGLSKREAVLRGLGRTIYGRKRDIANLLQLPPPQIESKSLSYCNLSSEPVIRAGDGSLTFAHSMSTDSINKCCNSEACIASNVSVLSKEKLKSRLRIYRHEVA